MPEVEVEATCCLDQESFTVLIQTPEGWALSDHLYLEEKGTFCPAHAAIKPFRENQCPGCVGGWGDCGLWDSFAFSHPRHGGFITEDELASLESTGRCPRRVGGTFMLRRPGGPVETVDLSTPTTNEAGKALADGIRDYMERYKIGVT